MCLVLFAYKTVPGYRLIVAANRDEFLSRPTAPLAWWRQGEDILAGRDLQDGGTWLGMSRSGRFGVLTNYRETGGAPGATVSRGEIVPHYLATGKKTEVFLDELQEVSHKYRGFNLVVGDGTDLYYFSNRISSWRKLESSVYGLSNHLLETPWPKVERGKLLFTKALETNGVAADEFFTVLQDSRQPDDSRLPDTGIGLPWERKLAPIFITSEDYGTRSSAIVTITEENEALFYERVFAHGPAGVNQEEERKFDVCLKR